MKHFSTEEIRDLYNRFCREEISFPRMVEILNERVSERVSEFKEGDFLHSDWENENLTLICKEQKGDKIYSHAYKCNSLGVSFTKTYWSNDVDFRSATEAEKQELVDALAKEGKRWNAEKLCVEDIPKRRFKSGDKVRIKEGISSKTYSNVGPSFVWEMDKLIGETMTVAGYADDNNYVECDVMYWRFLEDWLEPYEELKKGDLAIFWDESKEYAIITVYKQFRMCFPFPHEDHMESGWKNAIKFESKEQYERLIRGEK